MIPTNEFATILAGEVRADVFVLVDASGNERFVFGPATVYSGNTVDGMLGGYSVAYDDPTWDSTTATGFFSSSDLVGADDNPTSIVYAAVSDATSARRFQAGVSVSASDAGTGEATVAITAGSAPGASLPAGAAILVRDSGPGATDITMNGSGVTALAGANGITLDASVVRVGTGTLRTIYGGAWTPLAGTANFGINPGNPPGYRIEGQRVFFRGGFVCNVAAVAGVSISAPGIIPQNPNGVRAIGNGFIGGVYAPRTILVGAGVGNLLVGSGAYGVGDLVFIDGMTYEI